MPNIANMQIKLPKNNKFHVIQVNSLCVGWDYVTAHCETFNTLPCLINIYEFVNKYTWMGSVRETMSYLLVTDIAEPHVNQCVRCHSDELMTQGTEICSLTIALINMLKVAKWAMERAMFRVSLRVKI